MKKLPTYYVIERDASDPRWQKYIEWLNSQIDGIRMRFDGDSQAYYWYNGSEYYWWFRCFNHIWKFENNPTLITLDDWEEATQGNKKPWRHTYTTSYRRDDWVVFTSDTIDSKKITNLESEEKEHYTKARAIRALLNAHRNLEF